MNDKKKKHVEFAPGAFDSFDGTQEELDALVAELYRMADSGELEEMSIPLDESQILDDLSDEDIAQIQQALESLNTSGNRRLQ